MKEDREVTHQLRSLIDLDGSGNPGGQIGSFNEFNEQKGYNGTGGLLIIHANSFTNNSSGKVLACGVEGRGYSGGSSGGGSINIFYRQSVANTGTISAHGGFTKDGASRRGGNGSVSVGSISTSTYVNSGIGESYSEKLVENGAIFKNPNYQTAIFNYPISPNTKITYYTKVNGTTYGPYSFTYTQSGQTVKLNAHTQVTCAIYDGSITSTYYPGNWYDIYVTMTTE